VIVKSFIEVVELEENDHELLDDVVGERSVNVPVGT
jgi:hypothetical protein